MKVVPLGDNVVVKRMEAQQSTNGGIMLPDNARPEIREGRVLSVGDGRLLGNGCRAISQVTEGDRVVFRPYAGTELSVEGEDFLIMNQEDILAVMGR